MTRSITETDLTECNGYRVSDRVRAPTSPDCQFPSLFRGVIRRIYSIHTIEEGGESNAVYADVQWDYKFGADRVPLTEDKLRVLSAVDALAELA